MATSTPPCPFTEPRPIGRDHSGFDARTMRRWCVLTSGPSSSFRSRGDRSTYPVRPSSDAKAGHLQRRLWAAARRSPERRLHVLYDRIHRDDILWVAWERVRRNRGAEGVDT